jgi:ribosome biogenesis SPOUT family RNA methylase Rps3
MPTYCVEHLEPEINDWTRLEYLHMKKQCSNFILFVGKDTIVPSDLDDIISRSSCQELPLEKVVLLDPQSTKELSPHDDFEYVLFGGILGDDPPQDRTGILRKMGYATRHLGPVQMTTDTAVLVTKQVLERKTPLSQLEFVDRPEIRLSKKEVVEMPFRYLKLDGEMVLCPGMLEHLRKQNDESLQ